MAALQYRQLDSPAQVNTSIPDSGGAQKAETLANAFKHFESGLSSISTQIQTKQGEMAGASAGAENTFGTKAPGAKDFNRGLMQFSTYAKAYNNSALRSYAV